jgi:hypothetical protein
MPFWISWNTAHLARGFGHCSAWEPGRDARAVEAVSRCPQDETRIPDFGPISSEAAWALRQITGRAQETN